MQERRTSAVAGQAGMTLLEIMIVLAIIALVTAFLIGPAVMGRMGEAKVTTAHTMAKKFAYEAYPQWSVANSGKQCPESLASLTKYMNSEDTKDPWGREFVMMCGESAGDIPQGFGIMSKGEKEADPADDLKSWLPPPSQ